MFDVSDFVEDVLRSRARDLIYVFEFYSYDYEPFPEPTSGNLSFDPRHAVKRFAGQNISFDLDGDSVSYQRQVLDAPAVSKKIGKQFDTASLRLSNVDRSTAAWILSNKIQGMRMVVRTIPRSAPSGGDSASCFGHSIILFVGRVNKPDDFNRQSGTISATQDLGSIEVQIPPRQYQPTCPLVNVFKLPGHDCMGNETMAEKSPTYQAAKTCNGSFAQCTEYENTKFFQGTRIIQLTSSFVYRPHRGLFTRIINIAVPISIPIYNALRRKTVVGNSIHDGTPYGQPISTILGRWKKKLTALQFQDTGETIWFKMAACLGKIHDFLNIVNEAPNFSQPLEVVKHLGEYGGTGTQTQDAVFPDGSYHSKLAYFTGRCIGSDVEVEDPAPDISSVVVGQSVRIAFGTVNDGRAAVNNVFAGYSAGGDDYDGWTDNPVDQARFIITDPSYLALPTSHIAERATVRTASYCIGPIKDTSNTEHAIFPASEVGKAGTDYKRYYSTGMIGGRSFRIGLAVPQAPNGTPNREAEYEFDSDGSIAAGTTAIPFKPVYRKRYSSNIEVNEQKKAIDFLYDTLFPAGRLFLRWDALGRLAIDCERPADHSYLRQDIAAAATSIKVLDVLPWKPLDSIINEPEPLRGKILIGAHRLNSEVRPIATASYSAEGDAITLDADATGGLTATPSGATLSGGSSSVPSQGIITVGGTPAAGDTLTAIIDGFEITVEATTEDQITQIPDNLSIAEQLIYAINAEPVLQDYVVAIRGVAGGFTTEVVVYSKYGVLNFTTPLAEDHFAEIANPTVAPTLGASAGSLEAGTYLVSYAYRNSNGNTLISPIAAIELADNEQIDVTGIALPVGSDSVDWFVSVDADSGAMLLVLNNDGSGFSIDSLPAVTEADVPKFNTTGEEILRVMMSFAGRALVYADTTRANVLDGSFSWPEGGRQSTVNQVKTKYREAIQDFGEQPLVVNDERHQRETSKVNSVDIDLSAVDNFNQAYRLCNGYLAKLRDGDFFFKHGSAGEALLLEIGDVICVSDDSGGWRNVPVRIEEAAYNQKFEVNFTNRIYSTRHFDDFAIQKDVPLPSALTNFAAPPAAPEFNEVDFPPNGLVQTLDGSLGLTSVRGGGIVADSIYAKKVNVRLTKRGGVTVSETIASNLIPNDDGEVTFEFIATEPGLYVVQIQSTNRWGASEWVETLIVIGLGAAQGLWDTPMVELSGSGSVEWTGAGTYNIPMITESGAGDPNPAGGGNFDIP